MSKEFLQKINVSVTKECWKKLKILSVQNEIKLPEQVKIILERSVARQNTKVELTE
jgi:hypothetical protein